MNPDIIIIGSGMGGASLAAGLAQTDASILMLERGHQISDTLEAKSPRAVFASDHFLPNETWLDEAGRQFRPGNHYNVGGNSKFYGAVLIRYREQDFGEVEHEDGVSPAWPITYQDLAPWYDQAEALYQVRGTTGQDVCEPGRTFPYPHAPVPDEPSIAEARERLRATGLSPFSLPLGVDIAAWTAKRRTTFDGFPDTRSGKMDAETCGLATARSNPNFELRTNARVVRLEACSNGRIERVVALVNGEEQKFSPKIVVLAAGAIQSAALLLASDVANKSDQVGRNYMNHNASAILAIDPRFNNTSQYQKTFGVNDYYFDDGAGGYPLGNIQLLGRVTGDILRGQIKGVPGFLLDWVSRHAVDFYAITEDLPDPESRVTLEGNQIRLSWKRSNLGPHKRLVRRFARDLKRAGFPIVLNRLFDASVPSHQCGTVRIGRDPALAPLRPDCRAFDHPNLYVVDAGCLPTSAAVNPALSVAAMALRAADTIKHQELGV
ncbi:choline dehydrogenase-like flavoprotein [Roseibium hamelinense]|uniref:Choline dehydrogenase-like flavoprotein n=1 Tax=Roseibium hamelinense TaxID=150831 RepID=A0A562SXH0_9HYPH|nr:GMC family oxidoreductase [Roseibium hamelinense]MTI44809.1 GMC family oxidoreductase [Roseibium hamelinense]TWI85999.1 choline dehydrogenase-like flavoprotein [Roseibium hamelinense]